MNLTRFVPMPFTASVTSAWFTASIAGVMGLAL
uniref:Uncharacterized protein n=1 Tax=Arundo donax TaxID=35708 RepID=A0A0A9HEA0_ARUDO